MQYEEMQLKIWKFDEPITHWDVLLAFERDGQWYSRKDIANNLRCAKSPSMISKLTDLAAYGFLHIEDRVLPNGVSYFKYALSERGLDAIKAGGFPPNAFNNDEE